MAVLATGAVTEEALAGRPDELEREGFSEAARDGAVTEARGAAREDLSRVLQRGGSFAAMKTLNQT
jgi:hypothetical protein